MNVLLFLLFTTTSHAATLLVRDGGNGSSPTTSWAGAYDQISQAETAAARGDTILVAIGNYTGVTFNTAVNGTSRITVRRATIADHGTSTGWSDAYDGLVSVTGTLEIESGYWTIDGVTGGGPLGWTTGYLFVVTQTGASSAAVAIGRRSEDDDAPGVTVRHVKTIGMANGNTNGGSQGNDAIAVFGDSNITLSHNWHHEAGRCPYFFPYGVANIVVEYSHVTRYWGHVDAHSELCSMDTPSGDVTFRYNLFAWSYSTGGIQWGDWSPPSYPNATLRIYGNVWYRSSSESWGGHGNGDSIGSWTAGSMHDVLVYQNTFINIPIPLGGINGNPFDNLAANNLFVTSDPSWASYDSHNYNHYVSSGGTDSESNGTSATGTPASVFPNLATLNFTPGANTTAGQNLGAPYNFDMFGNPRTTWTRGAIEFSTGVDTNAPYISSISSGTPTENSASITFVSDEPATNMVIWGLTTAYGSTNISSTFGTGHGHTLSGLLASTNYHWALIAGDSSGNTTNVGGDRTFTTAAPDVTAPAVTLTAPANASSHTNTVTLTATASDAVGVVGVEFFVDGVLYADDLTDPYSVVATLANGAHTVFAKARDSAPNVAFSADTNSFTFTNMAASGLAAHWKFDGDGTDEIGTNDLTVSGPTYVAGKFGQAASFDGVNDYMTAPNSPALNVGGTNITFVAWFKITSTGTYQQIGAKNFTSYASPFFGWHLAIQHVDTNSCTPFFQINEEFVPCPPSFVVLYGEWVQLVGTYDGVTVRTYVNGIERASAPLTGTIAQHASTFTVGTDFRAASGNEMLAGLVDEMQIYTNTLTASQISALYTGPASGSVTIQVLNITGNLNITGQ